MKQQKDNLIQAAAQQSTVKKAEADGSTD